MVIFCVKKESQLWLKMGTEPGSAVCESLGSCACAQDSQVQYSSWIKRCVEPLMGVSVEVVFESR